MILSTHILPEVESVCDRVQILNNGKVVYADTIAALRQTRGGQALTVAFLRPPAPALLAAIEGVREVEALSAQRLRVFHGPESNPAQALVRRSVELDWGLVELTPVETTLEEVFINLTQRDDAEVAEATP